MKLFTREEAMGLEAAAQAAGVPLSQLMEGAGAALAEEAESRLRPLRGKRVVLLCGKGNNGGDGFVCARLLQGRGAACTVALAQGEPAAQLAQAAYRALPETVPALSAAAQPEQVRRALEEADAVLDCVFGFSFRGGLPQPVRDLFALANRLGCLKLAADLPSGAECDTGRASPGAFQADVTVAFTGLKPAHASYPAKALCGETVVRQVGVPAPALSAAQTRFSQTDLATPAALLRRPGPQSHKGDLGSLLLVCGSYGMAGACVLAARGALRCGVGLLRVAADQRIYPILAQALPEAVFLPLDWEGCRQESQARLRAALENCSACVVGSGLGDLADTVCPTVFAHRGVPLVADADALNFAARHPGVLEDFPAPLVLTPHPGEMARLRDGVVAEVQADRLEAAREMARETGAVVALKGAATVIAGPDGRCAVNPTGNPGMAKGGSGDVLAGIIGSLAAQGMPPFEAAVCGAYLHGLAGDLSAKALGQRAMLPTDLLAALPQALQQAEGLLE